MKMRPSRVLKKLRDGKVVRCVKTNLADPRVVEIAGMCGFDCVWLDMEHVPSDWIGVENQIRAAKIYDCDAMVRVARGSYSSHIKPLEADASGIMVPHVMSFEDAKKIVWQTRFHPIGRRAVDGGNADGAYCLVDFNDYIKTANEQRFVVVQIEDPEPLNDLEAICDLPGIEIIFFGPADFSQGIGVPGKWDDPHIVQTRKRIAEIANKKGKVAGTVGKAGNLQELIDMGYRFINVGSDVVGLALYFKSLVAAFDKLEQSSI
ncbi:MAG: aldolase [Planctomycetes bacterium GWF2_42_9]|nr:MAG: aldolase [Planctomycetes bacterium GWF2_42_9]